MALEESTLQFMYVFQHNGQLAMDEFYLPFGGKFDPNNLWVVLSNLIPWLPMECQYAHSFSATSGAPPPLVRQQSHFEWPLGRFISNSDWESRIDRPWS